MTFLFVPGLQIGTGIDLYDSRHLERGSRYARRDVWKSALHVQDATHVLVDAPCSPSGFACASVAVMSASHAYSTQHRCILLDPALQHSTTLHLHRMYIYNVCLRYTGVGYDGDVTLQMG